MRLAVPTYRVVACRRCGAKVGERCRGTTRNAHGERITDAYRLKSREAGRRARQALLTKPAAPVDAFPEHEKLRALRDKSQACGEFLEWLQERYTIAEYHVHNKHCQDEAGRACLGSTTTLYPSSINVRKLLAEFFEIDEEKLEDEKTTMLAAMRKEKP